VNRERAYDAVIVGSGPNGLAAAIHIAHAGRSTLVLERASDAGGGLRSAELTLPGYIHDVCSEVVPLTLGSPFLSMLPLADFGLRFVQPPIPLAHPLDDGSAAVLHRSLEQTAAGLGADAGAYTRIMQPLVGAWRQLLQHLLGPFTLPRRPISLARFGVFGILPVAVLARVAFRQDPARALIAGTSAHSILPLERPASAAFGLVLGMLAHAVGWPIVGGGTRRLAEALVAYLAALGGEVRTNCSVESVNTLPPHRVALLDVTPRQVDAIAGAALPDTYRRLLGRYRYGPGVCKVDWALDAPIPWTAQTCRSAGTVHIGGTLDEVAAAERAVWRGEYPDRPFVVLAQPTVFDSTRAPAGSHTVWAYCHVPNGSSRDMTDRIEAQVERFAPGFKARIVARSTHTATSMEDYNPNYVGGDINGGVQDLLQLWTRPVPRLVPYSTPNPRIFICSSSTPPGGGVHGMCGFHAARAALRSMSA
jgi:phytoene dehydrogenase-like protein